jgi:hypothetical protein
VINVVTLSSSAVLGKTCITGKVCLLATDVTICYNMCLVMFEMRTNDAWSGVGAKRVLEEAPERLKTSGWNSLRPALDVTVKCVD